MSEDEKEQEFDRFIVPNFRGWPDGQAPHDRPGRLRCVRAWLRDCVAPFRASALALMACTQPILDDLEKRILQKEPARLFCRIDTEHLCKEPESILDKMIRKGSGSDGAPLLSFENFRDQMKDLARFRIVTNFLSDARLVRAEIAAAFGTGNLTEAQGKLREGFLLENNNFEDCTRVLPAQRSKGERCFKGIFWPRENPGLKVEVQIMTILQEAWDKKDHFLIYEGRRSGKPADLDDEIEMFAISELLFVADLTFDRLRTRIIDDEGDADAPAK